MKKITRLALRNTFASRVEAAKKMLETKSETFDEICCRSGYENSSHFRGILKNLPGFCRRNIKINFLGFNVELKLPDVDGLR
ncbi:MAG: helix-turn-helix domain-containing protein [Deltaproteobacteria bacterium]|nr:helix-turn-helix domain-containing protein [Deltaproteobacteria bacterium]